MSQLIAPSHTLVDNIPLGRRISEIMAEKGAAYSISAMAKRLEINRETYRQMLKGDREIYTFELEKIAHDLKFSMDRILQVDVVDQRHELEHMLANATDISQMIKLSENGLEIANGLTERCIALNNVGRSYYWAALYDRSLEIWLQALPMVQECYEKYDEDEWLIRVSGNLMLTYCDNNQYSKFKEIFTYTTPLFEKHPKLSSIAYNSLAKFYIVQGDLEKARKNHLLSLHYSSKTDYHLRTAKFTYNIAYMEYKLKRYHASLEILEGVLDYVDSCNDMFFKINVYQFYSKYLLRIRKFDQAKQFLKLAGDLSDSLPNKQATLETERNFLYAIIYDDPSYAKYILDNDKIHIQMRKLACKFLVDHYEKNNDLEAKNHYLDYSLQHPAAIDMLFENRPYTLDEYLNFYDFCDIIRWNTMSDM